MATTCLVLLPSPPWCPTFSARVSSGTSMVGTEVVLQVLWQLGKQVCVLGLQC
jgi:hypothetical protein